MVTVGCDNAVRMGFRAAVVGRLSRWSVTECQSSSKVRLARLGAEMYRCKRVSANGGMCAQARTYKWYC